MLDSIEHSCIVGGDMGNSRTADAILSALGEYGVAVKDVARWREVFGNQFAPVTLERSGIEETYYLISPPPDYGDSMLFRGLSDLPPNGPESRILIAMERVTPRMAVKMREHGFEYIDVAGNALINFGPTYIDVQGRSISAPSGTTVGQGVATNLFSPRRSQVIFVLVEWPEVLDLPLRLAASVAGVSTTQYAETLRILRDEGFLVGDSPPHLMRTAELIDRWTAAYPGGLQSKLLRGRFQGDVADFRGVGPSLLVSGESAVREHIRPTTLTVYAPTLESDVLVSNRWRSDPRGNIRLMHKFWATPAEVLEHHFSNSGLFNVNAADPEHKVPDLLIYADLIASADERQREVAGAFREARNGFVTG
jgi:hypothetical protein